MEAAAYHGPVRGLKTFAAVVLAGTATPLAVGGFSKDVPIVVPSVAGWTRISGDLELADRQVAVRYEFYVNPARPAIYEVVRYRVTPLVPTGAAPRASGNEKLQWDRDGRDLRRFECVASAGRACAWTEMEKSGADYRMEVPFLIQLYGAHNRRENRD
jgi:hypothetical protein